jgi:hypothetical protein
MSADALMLAYDLRDAYRRRESLTGYAPKVYLVLADALDPRPVTVEDDADDAAALKLIRKHERQAAASARYRARKRLADAG